MFKLTKNLPIQGCVGISGFMRMDLTKMKGKFRWVVNPVGAMYFAKTLLSN